ncbi:MAG: exodeoxyribonuclease VII large subunit [Paenibacillaceae bacterium ZCTH02-B3]|nr:MAG: exodeoxyribonuclease VII large subunit [Paenibacillaceae bacterium ZCTH02-B3]
MDAARILTVRELNRYIKLRLDRDELLQDVWVRGEISNFKHHTSGHMYFTLKDEGGLIRCVMFASHNQRLPFLPKDGMKVLARGGVSVFERDGQYQLYVTTMQPDGIGSLHLAFEQLKRKLQAEGLFDPTLKRPIPPYPRTVGVITSPTGAAVRDIITTLQRRNPSVRILLYPVQVQGTGAAPSIVRAIAAMNRLGEADVLIVGRGGGSLEELWAFNEEAVARAIRASRIPVISAVGHETDFTIADFAADLRAPTPTAAAELAVPHAGELQMRLVHLRQRMTKSVRLILGQARERWGHATRSPYFTQPHRVLLYRAERLDRLADRLRHRMEARRERARERLARLNIRLNAASPLERIAAARSRSDAAARALKLAVLAQLRYKRDAFAARLRELDALSPLKVMARGYGLVYDAEERTIIRSVGQVRPGDRVRVRLADGRMDCRVQSLEREEKPDGG